MKVFINNKFYSASKAKISVFDRGLLYGDGMFETLRAYDSKIFLLEKHLKRLRQSARLLKIRLPWSNKYLTDILYKTLRLNKLKDSYIRLTVTRGKGGIKEKTFPHPTLIIAAEKFKSYSGEFYPKGVKISISGIRRNHPLCLNPEIKSLNFLNNILARIDQNGKNVFESIMCNLKGYITEGTVSNIFIIKNGILKTSSRQTGLLPGITRETVIKIAKQNKIPVQETLLKPKDIISCQECFLTNTLIEIMPVKQVNNRPMLHHPGRITQFLFNQYKKFLNKEITKK